MRPRWRTGTPTWRASCGPSCRGSTTSTCNGSRSRRPATGRSRRELKRVLSLLPQSPDLYKVVEPKTYDIQPQGHCLRHTTTAVDLSRLSYPIDESLPHARLLELVPLAGVLVPGLSGRAAQHLPLAPPGDGAHDGLPGLVHAGGGGERGRRQDGRPGSPHHRGRGHPAGGKRPARHAQPRLPTGSADHRSGRWANSEHSIAALNDWLKDALGA